MLAILALTTSFSAPNAALPSPLAAANRPAVRAGTPVAQDVDVEPTSTTKSWPGKGGGDLPIAWAQTASGYKYIDDVVGTGAVPSRDAHDVVQLHYSVTLLSSGTTLGSSRNTQPLTFALGKHDVPIWDEALEGMRLGGKRRLLVPPSAIPKAQKHHVPGEDRVLRFDFELLRTLDAKHPMAMVAQHIPPQERSKFVFEMGRNIYTFLFALSFVPYFLPYDKQPAWYHDGLTPEQIAQKHVDQSNSRYLGGDVTALNDLFPPP